jgi:hypothetical protein
MGDHRCSIEIKWSMHGHEKTADMWYNYHPSDDCIGYRVDRRVLEWLTEQYDKSMSKWEDMQDEEAQRRERLRREEMSDTERRIEDLRREANELEAGLKTRTSLD